ncbi:MAG: DNA gyrase subunit A [Alphaproteobacteria bacterium]|nr:DNA gyrase subunit A [Alphaproteobacteria bacterium]
MDTEEKKHNQSIPTLLKQEMETSYLSYAMSVIVSRALPDVRDGLKPVHRRIMYAMREANLDYNKPHRKSARVVGDVMGKYHPHGDSAIYQSMARMAQTFSMRLPLVDGQGNFGSMDGDAPAAMRYTEARLAEAAHYLLNDINKDTVAFTPNYDESTKEPVVLPAAFPNLLVNGAGGIAVGLATNIPPHNLVEVLDACCALIEDPDTTLETILTIVKGPDFPTGGQILGEGLIQLALTKGHGSIPMRGKAMVEETDNSSSIIITEIPFQVNKARLVEQIALMAKNQITTHIADLRDESDRSGVRVVVDLKRTGDPHVLLNLIYKHTSLQTSFGVNMVALHEKKPQVMPLMAMLKAFLVFREEVVRNRIQFDLHKAKERAHIIIGLMVSVAHIDRIIAIIRGAEDPKSARASLMSELFVLTDDLRSILSSEIPEGAQTHSLSEAQAQAILDLRLHRLTGLEQQKLLAEWQELCQHITDLLYLLSNRSALMDLIKTDLIAFKEKFGTPRRTEVLPHLTNTTEEDLIKDELMVVTLSYEGYIKRVPLEQYRLQRRGGKGRAGMATYEDDFVKHVFVESTHTRILCFSTRGIVYSLKVYQIPQGSPTSKGKAFINLLPLEKGESIATVMPLKNDESLPFIAFATKQGFTRRNAITDFHNIRTSGKIAIKLNEGDELLWVAPCNDKQDLFLSTRNGRCVRFNTTNIRLFQGRNSTGVRGIQLAAGDMVISAATLQSAPFSTEENTTYLAKHIVKPLEESSEFYNMQQYEDFILSISENGFGKRTSSFAYRCTSRNCKGIANMNTTTKTGPLIASFPVQHSSQLVLITSQGQIIRSNVESIRIAARSTQGVKLFSIPSGERVVSAVSFSLEDADEQISDDQEVGENTPPSEE